MEDSKAQDKILNLGKAIVKELKLDTGVDTLAKWIAHYVAEKIELAERLTGNKKSQIEKECFEAILKLWDYRWSIPSNKPFLQDFESLFATLSKLNPSNESPFFLPPQFIFEMEDEIRASKPIEMETESEDTQDKDNNPQPYLNSALRVDKLARSLIAELLNQAVSRIDLIGERKELIRNSIDAIDYPECQIIRIISDNNNYLESQTEDIGETKKRISTLKSKISDFEELISIIKSLTNNYKKELSEIEK